MKMMKKMKIKDMICLFKLEQIMIILNLNYRINLKITQIKIIINQQIRQYYLQKLQLHKYLLLSLFNKSPLNLKRFLWHKKIDLKLKINQLMKFHKENKNL